MGKIYVADKETLDSVKATGEATSAAVGGVQTTANSIKATGETILAELRGQRPKRYGYRVKESEGNPSTRVEYLFDAVGMSPAHMDYSNAAFNFGSWADVWFVRDNFPCMVGSDGAVDYALDPNDYTKKAADGSASDVANADYAGNAMSAIPLVWVKRYHENGYRYVIFCETQYDGGYQAYAHTRPDGTISPYAYGPMFEGSLVGGKLRSLSGQAPESSTTANAEIAAAEANGAAWTITTWAFWNLVHDLLVLLGKSTNIQNVFGQGHTTGGSGAASLLTTGTLANKGQFYGTADTLSAVKVFHMENFWGDRWERIVGLIYEMGEHRVKMTPEGSGYNLTGNEYAAVRKGVSTGGGYVKKSQQTPYGLFPSECGGSDATYDCDYHWYNNSIVSVPVVGGGCVGGAICGRCLSVDYVAGYAGWPVGASLFLKNPS